MTTCLQKLPGDSSPTDCSETNARIRIPDGRIHPLLSLQKSRPKYFGWLCAGSTRDFSLWSQICFCCFLVSASFTWNCWRLSTAEKERQRLWALRSLAPVCCLVSSHSIMQSQNVTEPKTATIKQLSKLLSWGQEVSHFTNHSARVLFSFYRSMRVLKSAKSNEWSVRGQKWNKTAFPDPMSRKLFFARNRSRHVNNGQSVGLQTRRDGGILVCVNLIGCQRLCSQYPNTDLHLRFPGR